MVNDVNLFSTIVIGLFAPLVISLLKDNKWSQTTKILFVTLFSLAVGTLTVYITSEVTWQNVKISATAVFTIATIAYKTFWQYTKTNKYLEGTHILPPKT